MTPPVPPVPPGRSDVDLVATADTLADRMKTLTDSIGSISRDQKKSWRAILGSYGLWVVDIALIVVAIVFGSHVATTSKCQAEKNDAFLNASIQSRTARDAQDNRTIEQLQAQLTLLDSAVPGSTLEQRLGASVKYRETVALSLEAIKASKQSRADNPLPVGNCS